MSRHRFSQSAVDENMHQRIPNLALPNYDPLHDLGHGHFGASSHMQRGCRQSIPATLSKADRQGTADWLAMTDRLGMSDRQGMTDRLGTADWLGMSDKQGTADRQGTTDRQSMADRLGISDRHVPHRERVNASFLHCPIMMMRLPNQTERGHEAHTENVRTHLDLPNGSEQAAGDQDTHPGPERDDTWGCHRSRALGRSTVKACEYHPMSHSGSHIHGMSHHKFCDCCQNRNNEGDTSECDRMPLAPPTRDISQFKHQINTPRGCVPSTVLLQQQTGHTQTDQHPCYLQQTLANPSHIQLPMTFGNSQTLNRINGSQMPQGMSPEVITPNYQHQFCVQTSPEGQSAPEAHFAANNPGFARYVSPASNAGLIADIRHSERFDIHSQLVPGRILQVHGAPMTGKSTIVRQVVTELVSRHQSGQVLSHHVTCKGVSTYQDFLTQVSQNWCPQSSCGPQPDTDSVIRKIGSSLQQHPSSYHVLVFHKCERLRDNPHGHQFLEFLNRLVSELAPLSISVVFTTYKYYWSPRKILCGEIEIKVLSTRDIIALLQHYVPDIDDCVGYACVLVKAFGFPEAVRLIAEQFLVNRYCKMTPEMLEKFIYKDHDFLSQLLESRLQEVDTWMPRQILLYLIHFMHSMENTFTEAHLEYVNSSDVDQIQLQKIICYLKQNHVVRSLPGINRLVIHPLVVYHSMVFPNRSLQLQPRKWFDNTCNKYTFFLGRVLLSMEASMQEHGRKGLVYAGLLQEWPSIKYVFQMALHCNINTYDNFIKVAISASSYILKIFPREAESFYWSLYNSARDYGTVVEMAVMEAFLGYAVAEGTGKDWIRANQYLSSAIEKLSRFGKSYFLAWTLTRKAIIHHRQGKYQESTEYFHQAEDTLNQADRWVLGEKFVVTNAKIDEEGITQKIHAAIPIIFTGHNREARDQLDTILSIIENQFENHLEIGTVLNLIGLTEQRGNRNLERALMWYKLAYHERMYWAKSCPESLIPVLNNIAMILFSQGLYDECLKYLEKALAIRRECGWTHFYTGLTLIHVAEVNMKMGNLTHAYKTCLEAERIYAATVSDHDTMLRVNFDLAHLRVLIRQALEPQKNMATPRPATAHRGFLGATGHEGMAHGRRTHRIPSWDTNNGSVTSSQLFEAGCDSPQEHLDNRSRSAAAGEVMTWRSGEEIEPCDLRMSAEDFLERLLAIASSFKGTLSDDGLSLVLSSHAHLMLLHLGNSPDTFEKHRMALVQFSQAHPWLDMPSNTDIGVDSEYRCLIKHRCLYNYVMTTPYDALNTRTFIEHMHMACLTCTFVRNAFTIDTWEAEAVHYMQEREIRMRRQQEFERMRFTLKTPVVNQTVSSVPITGDILVPSGHETVRAVEVPSTARDILVPSGPGTVRAVEVPSAVGDILVTSGPGLPAFTELLSDSSDEIRLQDGVRGREPGNYPMTTWQYPADTLFCQHSLDVPRIANTQQEKWRQIQDKHNSCSYTGSTQTETNMPGEAPSVSSQICHDNRSLTVSGLLVVRQPVEQSFLDDQGPVWKSHHPSQCDDLRLSKQSTCSDYHRQADHLPPRESPLKIESDTGIRQTSRDTRTDSRQSPVDTGYSGQQTDISMRELVLEKCKPGQTATQTDDLHPSTLECVLGQGVEESRPTQACPASFPAKFSVLDYYIKDGFTVNTQEAVTVSDSCTIEADKEVKQTPQLVPRDHHMTRVAAEQEDGRDVWSRTTCLDTAVTLSQSVAPCPLACVLEQRLRLESDNSCADRQELPSIHCHQHRHPGSDSSSDTDRDRDLGPAHHLGAATGQSPGSKIHDRCQRLKTVSFSSSESGRHPESGYSSELNLTGTSKTGSATCTRSQHQFVSSSFHSQWTSDMSESLPSDFLTDPRNHHPHRYTLLPGGTLQQEHHWTPQPGEETPQPDEETQASRKVATENSNTQLFREAIEQSWSWNETLIAECSRLSGMVHSPPGQGTTVRQELQRLEIVMRQQRAEHSGEHEDKTLSANTRHSLQQ